MSTETDAVALLQDHGRQPRNMGRLGQADAIGNVGSIVVGRALRFFIRVEEQTIVEAKFQVFACPEMVGSTSLLTELVVGKSIDEARALTVEDICAGFGGLDRHRLPLRPWGLAALGDALDRLQADEPPTYQAAGPSTLVCRCHQVDEATIVAAIAEGADSVEAIAEKTKAGTGCGSCQRDITTLLEKDDEPEEPQSAGALMGRVAVMKKIEAALAPLIEEAKAAGDGIELWDLAGSTLVVRLSGLLTEPGPARQGCVERIDRTLKDEVDPTLGVEIAS